MPVDRLITRIKNAPNRWKQREEERKRKLKLKKSGEVDKSKFDEDYVKEMEQRRKDSEAKKNKKTTPPKNQKKTPKKTEEKTPNTTPKTTEGKTPKDSKTTEKKTPKDSKKTEGKTPKDSKKTEKKTPKDSKKTENKDKIKLPKDRLTENKASDFLDGAKNPVKGEQAKKKPKKRLSAREKMRQKNERRFGKGHVDKLRKKNEDFKKMKRGQMTKAEFIKEHPKSITAQKHYGLRR